MLYRIIKGSDICIPAIGQGTAGIGGLFSKDTSHDNKWIHHLRLGIDLGMNFIDTAENYGAGHTEEIVGEAIHGIRDNVFIATKVSPEHCTYNSVIESAKASLDRLKTDWIDLYQIHWPNPRIPIDETMRAMESLVDEGKIRFIGLSNFSINEIKKAQSSLSHSSIVSIQHEYNLMDRTAELGLIPFCREQSLLSITWSPLIQGKIAPSDSRFDALVKIGSDYNMTTAQFVLNWLCHDPGVVTIPKSSNECHLRENAEALDYQISESDFRLISDIFRPILTDITADQIDVIDAANRNVYKTVSEAIENRFNFVPSPKELAGQILTGEQLKPIKVRLNNSTKSQKKYQLIEGRVRYWGWVIAYGDRVSIKSIIENN